MHCTSVQQASQPQHLQPASAKNQQPIINQQSDISLNNFMAHTNKGASWCSNLVCTLLYFG